MKNKTGLCKLLAVMMIIASFISFFPYSIVYADDSPRRSRLIVSMGDSYSSGEGVEPFWDDYERYIETGKDDRSIEEKIEDPNWLAHRSIWAWSGQLILPDVGVVNLTKHSEEQHWVFVASSGAETKHILDTWQYKPIKKGEYETSEDDGTAKGFEPQIYALKDAKSMRVTPDYVTLTIGGNDAGFQDIITTAVASYVFHIPGLVQKNLNHVWDNFAKDGGIRDDLKEVYNRIFEETGESTCILVGGYPLLFSPDDFDSNTPIKQKDAIDINRNIHNFNREIEKLIWECKAECKENKHKEMNIEFVSVEGAFGGDDKGEQSIHGAYSKDPYINEIIFLEMQSEDLKDSGLASAYSMHPNIYGICAYRDCFQAKINENEKKKDKNLPDNWIDEYKANAIREDSIGIGINIKDTPTIAPEETTTGGMNIDTEVLYSAYREVLSNYETEMRQVESNSDLPVNSCALTDITGDDIPELLIMYCSEKTHEISEKYGFDYQVVDIRIYTVIPGEKTATQMLYLPNLAGCEGIGFSPNIIFLSNGNLLVERCSFHDDVYSDNDFYHYYSYFWDEFVVDGYTFRPINYLQYNYYYMTDGRGREYLDEEYMINTETTDASDFKTRIDNYISLFSFALALSPSSNDTELWSNWDLAVNTTQDSTTSLDEVLEITSSVKNVSLPENEVSSKQVITTDQAKEAFENYWTVDPEQIRDHNQSFRLHFEYSECDSDDNMCVYLLSAYTGGNTYSKTYYYMDLITGSVFEMEYSYISEGSSFSAVPGLLLNNITYDVFNAWDYLDSSSYVSNSEAMEVRQFVGASLYEAVDSLGYLEDYQMDLENKWNSGDYYITKECDDIWDFAYWIGFDNEDIHLWTSDADVGQLDFIFCVTVKTNVYCIYGVSPGMDWNEAVDCISVFGVYEVNKYEQEGITIIKMNDGNYVYFSCDDDQIVRKIGVGNPNNGKTFPGTDGSVAVLR